MPLAEIRACSTSDVMNHEQMILKPYKEGHDLVHNLSKEIGKDPLISFCRNGERSVQWIELLHTLDQHGNNKFSNGTKIDNCVEGKWLNGKSFPSEMNVIKEPVQYLANTKGIKSSFHDKQALNFPAAVVALVQGAAKANSEPEKCFPGWPLLSPSKVQRQKCDKCSLEFLSTINYRRHKLIHRKSLNIDKDSSKNREFLGTFWDKLSLDDSKEILSFKNVSIEEVNCSSVIRALSSLLRNPGLFSLPESYIKAGVTLSDIVQERPSRLRISSKELFNVLDDASERTFLCAGTALSAQKFVFDGETAKIALEMKNLIACLSFMLEKELVVAWVADKDAEAMRSYKLLVEEEEAAQKRQAELLERKRLKKLRQKEQKLKESSVTSKADSNLSSPESIEGMSPSEPGLNTIESSLLDQDPIFLDSDAEFQNTVQDADEMGNGQEPSTKSRLLDQRPQCHRQPINFHKPSPNLGRNAQKKPPGFKSLAPVNNGNYRDQKAFRLANTHKIWSPKVRSDGDEAGSSGRLERENMEQEYKKENIFGGCDVLIGSINVRLGDYDVRNAFKQKQAKPGVKLCRTVNQPSTSDDLSGPRLFSSEAAEAFLAQRWREAIASDHVTIGTLLETETSKGGEADEETDEASLLKSITNYPKSANNGKSYSMKYVPNAR